MRTKNFNFKPAVLILLVFVLAAYVACTNVEDDTRSASLLSVTDVTGEPGGENDEPGDVLFSDRCDEQDPPDVGCVVFNDNAVVTFRNDYLQVGPGIGTLPSFLNDIIVNRYRVDYFRPNNRNTPGVDVPFGFDGTMDQVVNVNGTADASIVVVRHVSKDEPPIAELFEDVITAQAQMRFFGRDLAGRTVSATGFLEIHFGNFGEGQ